MPVLYSLINEKCLFYRVNHNHLVNKKIENITFVCIKFRNMNTDPAFYGLSSRVQLEQLDNRRIGIRKVIKSRIILKDAEKIVAMAR